MPSVLGNVICVFRCVVRTSQTLFPTGNVYVWTRPKDQSYIGQADGVNAAVDPTSQKCPNCKSPNIISEKMNQVFFISRTLHTHFAPLLDKDWIQIKQFSFVRKKEIKSIRLWIASQRIPTYCVAPRIVSKPGMLGSCDIQCQGKQSVKTALCMKCVFPLSFCLARYCRLPPPDWALDYQLKLSKNIPLTV